MITEILSHLPGDFPWRSNIQYFDTLVSTNSYAKELAAQGAPHGTVVIAGMQTAGRGRMGRSFYSPKDGGIYLSVILRPNCPASMLMHLTCAAGVAMCDAVEETTGLRSGIKWINDLVLGNKKLGGILTELSLAADSSTEYAVVGIGINCNQNEEDFPEELRSVATSLSVFTEKSISLSSLAASMIRHLRRMDFCLLNSKKAIMDRYRLDCVTLGKDVTVHAAQSDRTGYAFGIDDDGALQVRFPDGSCESISSGEASVRGMYSYA